LAVLALNLPPRLRASLQITFQSSMHLPISWRTFVSVSGEMRVALVVKSGGVEEAAEGPDGHGADRGGSAERRRSLRVEGRIAELPIAITRLRMKRSTSRWLDRRIAKQVAEGASSRRDKVFETRPPASSAGRGKLRLARHGAKAVPGATPPGIVAAIDAVAMHAEFARCVLVLDGEIGKCRAAHRFRTVR